MSGRNAGPKAFVDSIKVPQKLRCKACQKLKVSSHFSEYQMIKFKRLLAANPRLSNPNTATIECAICSNSQRDELECANCEDVKSIEDFSRTQRRNGDLAVSYRTNGFIDTPTIGRV